MQIVVNGNIATDATFSIPTTVPTTVDGIFETVRIHQGQPVLWQAHLERLARGCAYYRLPAVPAAQWEYDIQQALGDVHNAIVKLVVATDPITHSVTRIVQPRVYDAALISAQQTQGIRLIFCNTPLPITHYPTDIKPFDRSPYHAALDDIHRANVDDGLLLNEDQHVIESTIANLFLVKAGQLFTPELSTHGIQGLARASILAYTQQQGNTVIEQAITQDDCLQADELFLCNSVRGILPIVQLEQQHYPVGEMTRELQHVEREFLL